MSFQHISSNIERYKKSEPAKKKVFRWQELADQICKELQVPSKERNLIFKICYEHPESFVEHCFRETKELAQGDLKHHYFVKLVYKKEEDKHNA